MVHCLWGFGQSPSAKLVKIGAFFGLFLAIFRPGETRQLNWGKICQGAGLWPLWGQPETPMAKRGASSRPSAGFQSDQILIKLDQNLIHFEPGRGGLEEASRPNGAGGGFERGSKGGLQGRHFCGTPSGPPGDQDGRERFLWAAKGGPKMMIKF